MWPGALVHGLVGHASLRGAVAPQEQIPKPAESRVVRHASGCRRGRGTTLRRPPAGEPASASGLPLPRWASSTARTAGGAGALALPSAGGAPLGSIAVRTRASEALWEPLTASRP